MPTWPGCPARGTTRAAWRSGGRRSSKRCGGSERVEQDRIDLPAGSAHARLTAMATRLMHVTIDSADPSALARFWAAALGWEVTEEDQDGAVVESVPTGFS